MPDDQLLYTIEDACKRLGGISRSNFYNLVNTGQLRSVKVGRRRYLTDTEMRRFAASLKSEGAAV